MRTMIRERFPDPVRLPCIQPGWTPTPVTPTWPNLPSWARPVYLPWRQGPPETWC